MYSGMQGVDVSLLKTGDILLVRCSHLFGRSVRAATRQEWDHLVLLIRCERDGKLCTLEATGDGCHKYTFATRMQRDKWERVGVRRLSSSLGLEQQRTIEAFAAEVEGLPYKRSRVEAVRAFVPGPCSCCGLTASSTQMTDSYFCSELVAEAFRRIGLLPPHIKSHRYAVQHFLGAEPRLQGNSLDALIAIK